MIKTKELFGTTLRGPVSLINNGAEHKRVGLVWEFHGDYLTIQKQPRPGANLAAHRMIAEEVAAHVAAGGVDVSFDLISGPVTYEIRSGTAEQID